MNRGRASIQLEQRLERLEWHILELRENFPIKTALRFGYRDLRLHLLTETQAFEALTSPSGGSEQGGSPINGFELTSQQFELLKLDGTTALSAYDAMELGAEAEWKVIYSTGVRAVFIYSARSRNAFFFGLSQSSERARGEVFRHLAHWVAIEDGGFLLHGASLTRGGQAVLVTGNAGAGKSSLILQGLDQGFQFQGDNVIEIRKTGEVTFHTFGIYRSLKRRPSSPMSPPPHSSRSFDEAIEKEIFYVECERFESRACEVVKVLHLDPELSAPRSLSSGELLFLLGPNSIGQFPLYEGLLLSRIREFVERATAIKSPRMSKVQVDEILRGDLVE